MDSLWLVKVKFHSSNREYSYQAPFFMQRGDLAVVLAPNGEFKVVTVVMCSKTTRRCLGAMGFEVKHIIGVVAALDKEQPKTGKAKKTRPATEDDSPV